MENKRYKNKTKNKNILKCSNCGTEIYTETENRSCYKCGAPMVFIGERND